MSKHYELTLVVGSQDGDEAVNSIVGKYESFLKDNGADPVVADRRGVQKLAYEIKKQNQADYTYFQFTGEAAMVQEMDRQLRLDESVLRHLFIKTEDAPVVPQDESEAEEAEAEETVTSGENEEAEE
ncbi:TPA: 30S ribosomal protein S6 [Candidatus Latescibacteria bacterium]|nr:30S ribosomal protein S6 [Gemmatimonadota bacterium]HAA77216.1 30S ribosomal protein S6 [Candidatus Latescibacterota bacterium]|tara:strand:- start:3117 stop:3497 length:381 start_codon:yes stop_codon:yes gene_type:complete